LVRPPLSGDLLSCLVIVIVISEARIYIYHILLVYISIYSPDLSLLSSTFVPRLPAFVKPKVFLLQLGYSPNPPPHLFSTPVLDERRHVMAPAQTSIPPAANILGVRHALYASILLLMLTCAPFLTDNRHCLLVCPDHPTDMA
jgi:hypothetical protein